ncbi:hypothetical protein D3C84_573170 [compost metagenome]
MGGFTSNVSTVAQSDDFPLVFPICFAVIKYFLTGHAVGEVTVQVPSLFTSVDN